MLIITEKIFNIYIEIRESKYHSKKVILGNSKLGRLN